MALGRRQAGALGMLALLLSVTATAPCFASAAPRVDLGGSVLEGQSGERHPQVASFRGIPYAQPPVGELRWQSPRPLGERPPVRQATQFAAACYQDSYNTDWYRKVGAAFGADPAHFSEPRVSEDCLYLNVWTPRPADSARRPVMVWIHGGANRSGWSFEPNYLGESLAARGVVVVSIAYRVGVFGFFGHPQLDGNANFGLQDQIAALQWVQDHIAAFGGDAGNVTVFGESAGAADIGYLMASPPARGLFRRAISQSGGYQLLERRTLADVESWGRGLGAALPGHPDVAGLRRLDSATILAAANAALQDVDFGPAVDGAAVPAPLAGGSHLQDAPVDLLVGTNQDEWLMYVDDDAGSLSAALDALPAAARPALQELAASEPTIREGHDRAVTFANMVCAGYVIAGDVRGAGGRGVGLPVHPRQARAGRRAVARLSRRRDPVCLRYARRLARHRKRGSAPDGGNAAVLGELREKRQPEWRRPARMAGVCDGRGPRHRARRSCRRDAGARSPAVPWSVPRALQRALKRNPSVNERNDDRPETDWTMFGLTVSVLLIACIPVFGLGPRAAGVIAAIYDALTERFGILYLWYGIGALVFVGWLAASRYGRVKLGDADSRPEFTTRSWLAMIFCAGVGAGLLYWAIIEWGYYVDKPPHGFAPGSPEAIEWAASYGLFHWGPTGWAILCLPSLAIAYAYYVRKVPYLRLSTGCSAFFPRVSPARAAARSISSTC